jgi:hypothetical protein
MKVLFLTLFFFTTVSQVYGQQIHLQGCVKDAQTNQPVASTTISILSKRLYFLADNDGNFNIISDKINITDSVTFSCIGYQTLKFRAKELASAIVKLEPITKALQEVKVNLNIPIVKIGVNNQSSRETWTPVQDGDLAIFMLGSKCVKGTIQTVSYYVSNGRGYFKGGDVTAPFRVRIFSVDTDGSPGKELTKDTIIVRAKKEGWSDVDMSSYHIQNPDSGFYAAFSLLPYPYYQLKNVICAYIDTGTTNYLIDPRDMLAPRLGVISHQIRETKSYLSVNGSKGDMTWHWINDYFNWEYMIRATIATE